jgi:uncharacterized membrane protein (DUF373 family)
VAEEEKNYCKANERITGGNMGMVLKTFEKIIVLTLLGLMMIAVLVSTVELAVILFQQLMKPPLFLLNIEEMLEVFGFFLMVLIGLELLESIKAYLNEDRVHAEVVFLVAIVAMSRKVIIVDYREIAPEMLYGIAAVIIALAGGYFLVKRALLLHDHVSPKFKDEDHNG